MIMIMMHMIGTHVACMNWWYASYFCQSKIYFFESYNKMLSPYFPFLLYICILHLNVAFYI